MEVLHMENECTKYKITWDKGNKSQQFVGFYDVESCAESLFKLGYGEVIITALNESKY